MTAEQFSDQWHKTHMRIYAPDSQVEKHWLELAEAYAAAQLAEKEREIAQLRIDYQQELFHTEARAEAAEQRLQEAQAELDKCRDRWVKRAVSAEERLRQREAELDELREHCVSEHECTFAALPSPPKEAK